MTPELAALGRRRYVRLTTFRRSGAAVATAVWAAPAGDALVVMTGSTTGKAKRLRHTSRVELSECDLRGRVRPGAAVVHATAELVTDPEAQRPLLAALHRKYGWQARAFEAVEGVLRRIRPAAVGEVVVLRITDAPVLRGS